MYQEIKYNRVQDKQQVMSLQLFSPIQIAL